MKLTCTIVFESPKEVPLPADVATELEDKLVDEAFRIVRASTDTETNKFSTLTVRDNSMSIEP